MLMRIRMVVFYKCTNVTNQSKGWDEIEANHVWTLVKISIYVIYQSYAKGN